MIRTAYTGNRPVSPRSLETVWSRFLSRVEFSVGCWTWKGGLSDNGYGILNLCSGQHTTHIYAHRVAYEGWVGSIPEGFQIDHLCRNRRCVRPDHLEAVTGRENIRRGVGPSAQNARKTHCKRGHPFDEANTYVSRKGNRRCRVCIRLLNRQRYRERNEKRAA